MALFVVVEALGTKWCGLSPLARMFLGAGAFNQDLGWCVDGGVSLVNAFIATLCASTSCGVTQGGCPP